MAKEKKINLDVLKCKACKKHFGVEKDIVGVITCPYCSAYIEG